MKKKLLVIEPHSDDSIISCGGFLLKNKDKFDLNFCLVCASDFNMYHGFVSRETRIDEYKKYIEYFNGKFITPKNGEMCLPLDMESRLDMVPKAQLVKLIENAILEVKPDILMIMGPSFYHDHTIVYEAVIAATRPTFSMSSELIYVLENPTYVHEPYPGTFQANTYVQLDKDLIEKKCQLFEDLFPSQIRPEGNYLSKQGLKKWAQYRGIEARCDYAEAFSQFFSRI
jgi:N-acetylglucosamine malate deacetylase 1